MCFFKPKHEKSEFGESSDFPVIQRGGIRCKPYWHSTKAIENVREIGNNDL